MARFEKYRGRFLNGAVPECTRQPHAPTLSHGASWRPVDTAAAKAETASSARWGASGPRQGSLLPPNWFGFVHEPSSGPDSADSGHNGRKARMPRKITPASSLDTLKREAKRWLRALRANDADARARLDRAHPGAPRDPAL